MVSSINGKITRGDDPYVSAFASPEDAELFDRLKKEASLIIMGSKTYEVARAKLVLSPKTLRIVMTRDPKQYTAVPGQLEFTNESPSDLLRRLEQDGHKDAMLAGGAHINSLFLKEQLVTELRITIEPWILGKGKNLVEELDLDTHFKLVSTNVINDAGTIHLLYKKT